MNGNEIGHLCSTLSVCSEMTADIPNVRIVRPSTVKDVARLAGVSQATVSRVVSGATNVSRKTRAKVFTAVSSLQHYPNAHAARLRRMRGLGTKESGPTPWTAYPAEAGVSKARNALSNTANDVARLAGVSKATVSRVINSASTVSDMTISKVMSAVSILHYYPNAHAAELGRANGGIARKRGV